MVSLTLEPIRMQSRSCYFWATVVYERVSTVQTRKDKTTPTEVCARDFDVPLRSCFERMVLIQKLFVKSLQGSQDRKRQASSTSKNEQRDSPGVFVVVYRHKSRTRLRRVLHTQSPKGYCSISDLFYRLWPFHLPFRSGFYVEIGPTNLLRFSVVSENNPCVRFFWKSHSVLFVTAAAAAAWILFCIFYYY